MDVMVVGIGERIERSRQGPTFLFRVVIHKIWGEKGCSTKFAFGCMFGV